MKKNLNFKKGNGLIPAIIQEKKSGKVLMLGFMNWKALDKTMQSGFVWFWSRSRKALWQKGQVSGNKLKVEKIFIDCDSDTLLIEVKLLGKNVCHSGNLSCFYQEMERNI